MMSVFSLCMTAALCNQLMQKNRFGNAIRLVLGLEITRVILVVLKENLMGALKWS